MTKTISDTVRSKSVQLDNLGGCETLFLYQGLNGLWLLVWDGGFIEHEHKSFNDALEHFEAIG